MIKNILFVFVLLFLVSCGNDDKIPEGILKSEKMQAVLWDIIKAEAYTTEMIKADSLKKAPEENLKLQQQVFAIHKVTSSEFYKSYDHYKANTADFKVMLDSMIARGGRQKNIDSRPKPSEAE